MTLETQTGRVHHELLALGYNTMPSYIFTPYDMGRASGGFVCVAHIGVGDHYLEATGGPAATHKVAKSHAAVALLELASRSSSPPQVPKPVSADPDFLPPSPIIVFSPGEAKAAREIIRDVGVEYAQAAIAYYHKCSITPGSVRPDTSTPLSVEGSDVPVPSSDLEDDEIPNTIGEVALPKGPKPPPPRTPPVYPWPGAREISHCLSKILRHEALKLGMMIDPAGWVRVHELMNHLPDGTTLDDIQDVVYRSRDHGKPRFEMLSDFEVTGRRCDPTIYGSCVRATSKHSILGIDTCYAGFLNPLPGTITDRTVTVDPNRTGVSYGW